MTPRLKTWVAALGISAALLPGATFAGLIDTAAALVALSHPASSKTTQKRVYPLASAAEVFENLTEGAPSWSAAEVDRSLARFEVLHPTVSQRLPSASRARLDTLVGGVRTAWQQKDRATMALQSIEAYRLLQESMDYTGQPVPVEVSLLDYSGFKLNALMLRTQPDWKQVAGTAQESSTWWKSIEAKVTDSKLQRAMNQTVKDMGDGALRQDTKLVRAAATKDLALVDDLETFFIAHPVNGRVAPLAWLPRALNHPLT